MAEGTLKPVRWVGSSLDDLRAFPDESQGDIGHALLIAQQGGKHESAKPLKGYRGAGVLEIVEAFDGNAYRAVYTVKFADVIYVLHAFQKKSTRGIKTAQRDIDIVTERLKRVQEDHDERKNR
jgi:phage-related protein